MTDPRDYATWLRVLADRVDEAVEKEPALAQEGAIVSLTIPPERFAHAATAFGCDAPWDAMLLRPGFSRNFGPHRLYLVPETTPRPDPLADPTFVSPVRVLHPGPRSAA